MSNKPKSLRSRGFTLLELLVGAAVGAVVLVGISLTFISQAQQYQAHASRRGVQANARQALAFMERTLRITGYGVDPDRAVLAYDSYNPVTDTQQPGYPDAIVLHWRDALFRRPAQTVTGNSISLAPADVLKEPMRKGQILLVICAPDPGSSDFTVNSNPPHAFVTVGNYTPAGAANIPLDTLAPASAPNSPQQGAGRLFHEQTALGAGPPCFHSATHPPFVVLIHRAAFYVAQFDNDGDPATPERTPYLMMHQGLDMPGVADPMGDGTIDANDAVPVAEGIEQLQVAYILDTNSTDTDNVPIILGVNQLMGPDHYGENWEMIGAPSTYPAQPNTFPALVPGWFFNPGYPKHYTQDEMTRLRLADLGPNIRQVRLTVVARSSVPDQQIRGDNLLVHDDGTQYPDGPALSDPGASKAWRHLENLSLQIPAADFAPSGGHFYRTILRQAVAPKNLLLTRQFIPVNENGGG